MSKLDVLFTPAEYATLPGRDLSGTTCVVFDVLRATSTMLTALANGAEAVLPVSEIADAVAIRRQRPDVLLAGERHGLKITAAQSGGVDFDLGNSPREFTPERVAGRVIVTTTTNGTRALRACSGAGRVLVGALFNLRALTEALRTQRPRDLLLVCAGTVEKAAYEDALAAGGLCESLWSEFGSGATDSALMARQLFQQARGDLTGALGAGRNGRRLLAIPELAADVAVCARLDALPLVAALNRAGEVRRI
jgi:2-phosphosulfolactate phosphatase